MNIAKNILLSASFGVMGGLMCLALAAMPARAETTVTSTIEQQAAMPNTEIVDFGAFDLNGDGVLARAEVGERLFRSFDTDGNHVIDNVEYDNKRVLTVIPMERQTIVSTDFDDDGQVDEIESISYENFIEKSMLDRFAPGSDAIAANDFLGMGFWVLDTNDSKVIELGEWKRAYEIATRPEVAESYLYNQ